MFNCKYVENTPNTILKVINTQNSTHLLIHISKLFNPTQSVLSSGNLAQLGSRKLEVGSRKSEVGRPFSAFVQDEFYLVKVSLVHMLAILWSSLKLVNNYYHGRKVSNYKSWHKENVLAKNASWLLIVADVAL